MKTSRVVRCTFAAGLIIAASVTLTGAADLVFSNAPPALAWSQFRGVGLIDKLGPGWFPPSKFREADFQFVREAGFNFVRLPVDYRFLTREDDVTQFDEAKLAELDRTIAWGKTYGQHVCLALFAVPGYAINQPEQTPSLWTDAACQERFVGYWRALAVRYRAVPAAQLSFNLLNEPAWNVPESRYAPLMRRAIEAIRAEDAQRPIVVDGLKAGREPVLSLAGLAGVAQAAHFYEPHCFTHFGAHWTPQPEHLAPPQAWPLPRLTHHLFGPRQKDHSPLKFTGDFPAGARFELTLGSVCASSQKPLTLALIANGREVTRETVRPDESRPEWQRSVAVGEPGLKEYAARIMVNFTLPGAATNVQLRVVAGDRATFERLRVVTGTGGQMLAELRPTSTLWERQAAPVDFSRKGGFVIRARYDRAWLAEESLRAWRPLLARGVPVMIQEFGCHARVPQAAALAYLEDCLRVWQEAGLGWALYSLRGDMGLVDSRRRDGHSAPLSDGSAVDADVLALLKRFTHPARAPQAVMNFDDMRGGGKLAHLPNSR